MREILFRGKTFDGDWEFGCLHYEWGETDKNGNRAIDYRILGMRGECRYVIPETIGQFTGLTDKNGAKIFEGDIVSVKLKYINGDEWEEKKKVHYNSDECCWYPMRWNEECDFCEGWTEITRIEIIGNIHDNPELLEE